MVEVHLRMKDTDGPSAMQHNWHWWHIVKAYKKQLYTSGWKGPHLL